MRMPSISYQTLTFKEIALFWSDEDSAGNIEIKNRRYREIMFLFEEDCSKGKLSDPELYAELYAMFNRSVAPFVGADPSDEIAAGQFSNAANALKHAIENMRVTRDDFVNWANSEGYTLPRFWLSPERDISVSSASVHSQQPPKQSQKRVGRPPSVSQTVLDQMLQGLRTGQFNEVTLVQMKEKELVNCFHASRGVVRAARHNAIRVFKAGNSMNELSDKILHPHQSPEGE
jgi:hypothetical protein